MFWKTDPVTEKSELVGTQVHLSLPNGDRIKVTAVGEALKIESSGQLWIGSQMYNRVFVKSQA